MRALSAIVDGIKIENEKVMLKTAFSFAITLIITLVLTGCDQGCDIHVTSVAKIDNLTNRELIVNVCAGQRTKTIINLSPTQSGSINIAQHKEMRIKTGGPSNACDPVQHKAGVFLTAENFNDVKFCHSPETSSEVTVVEITQDCPAGLVAQTAPIATCP